MTYDTGNVKEVKKRKTKAQLAAERDDAWLREVLSTEGGRAVLYKILEHCGVYRSPITDPLETFRELGRQDVGRWLMGEIFTCQSHVYTTMREEASNREGKPNG